MRNREEDTQQQPRGPGDAIDELPLPYIELDAHGMVTRVNRATLALYPPGHGDPVGKQAWDFVAGDEQEASFAAYASLMKSGEDPPVIRRALFDRSGRYRTYEIHRSLVRGHGGEPCGVRMVGIDVTETLRAAEAANQARRWLESAVESVAEGMLLIDALGIIQSANPALEAMLGWRAVDLVGQVLEQAIPVKANHNGGKLLCFTTALKERTKSTAMLLDRLGHELKVEITTSPIIDRESGSTTGVVAVLRRIE
jgi:PAS domain S-box-containing protein